MEELNSGPPKTNPSSGREEDLNPGPPDYKSSALPLGHARLPVDKFGLDSRKLSSFVSNRAAEMTRLRSSVATKLKELNPQLVNFHCNCHRLALAYTDTLSNVSYINGVLKWLSQLKNST